MANRLGRSVARKTSPAPTALRTATVVELLTPTVDDATGVSTGWRVRLDFGGGEVLLAGVASSYEPVPGDTVAVASYLGTLLVIDRVTAGGGDDPPGRQVGLAYTTVTGIYATTVATEIEVTALKIAAVPMRNGAAYEVYFHTGYQTNTASQFVQTRLRQTNITGADLGEFFRQPTTLAGGVFGQTSRTLIANTTGIDLVVALVPTLAGPAGVTASLFSTVPASRAYLEINTLGPAVRYPHAAPITRPPDL